MEYLENKNYTHMFINYSRLFAYYNGRKIENCIDIDDGAEVRDVLKSVKKWGICDERLYSYNIGYFNVHPSNEAYLDAMRNKIKVYARVNQNMTDIKMSLTSGLPVIIGFTCYSSFDEVGHTGILTMPQRNEKMLGGHCCIIMGFDDSTQMLLIQNSYGSEWGNKGFFLMPYKYAINKGLADDFWVINKTKNT
jgi:C1A family cysteine protease